MPLGNYMRALANLVTTEKYVIGFYLVMIDDLK
jgi:hypothetical protein